MSDTESKEGCGCFIYGLGAIVVIGIILYFTGVLQVVTYGCTLPVDLVIAETCVFGSVGGSLGLTLLMTIGGAVVVGVLGVLGALIGALFKRKP